MAFNLQWIFRTTTVSATTQHCRPDSSTRVVTIFSEGDDHEEICLWTGRSGRDDGIRFRGRHGSPLHQGSARAASGRIYSWSGCYIGGNVGGGWERTRQTQIAKVGGPAIIPNNNFGSSTGTDFVGGGQIGCDYQFASNFVIGIQGMYDYGRIGSSHVVPTAFPDSLWVHSSRSIKLRTCGPSRAASAISSPRNCWAM